MMMLSPIIYFASLALQVTLAQTPEEWLDPRIDEIDRASMEELISYSPLPLGEGAKWILQEGEEAPTWIGLRGKVVVVQSWTNASSSGRLVVNAVKNILKRVEGPEDVVLILVHTPEEHEDAQRYCERRRVNTPTVVDTTGIICNSLGFYKTPTNILIDKNGRVRHVGLRAKTMKDAVDSLLEEPFDPDVEVEVFPIPDDVKREEIPFPAHQVESTSAKKSAKNIQGKAAPEFVIEEWISNPTTVNGKVRLVEFWATWCGPCVKGIPHLNDLAAEFKDEMVVIGVTDEKASKIRTFMQKVPMYYSVATDPQKRMKSLVNIVGIPHALLISSEGIVRWQGHPYLLTSEHVKKIIQADREAGLPLTSRGRWKLSSSEEDE